MKKRILLSTLLFASITGCSTAADLTNATQGAQKSFIVNALTPICATEIKKVPEIQESLTLIKKVIQEPEAKVCGCALEALEKDLTQNTAQVLKLATSPLEEQVNYLMGMAGTCGTEIVTNEFKDALGLTS